MEERHSGDERPKRAGWAGRNETAMLASAIPALVGEVV